MTSIRRALARLATLVRGHRGADADARAEMSAHFGMAVDEYVRRGLSPNEARRRAFLDAGGLAQAAEAVREQRGLPWLETLAADARYALRHFRRTPLSTATMVVVLSLGLGTNVLLFTIINSVATAPPPGVPADEALVRIRGAMPTGEPRLLSWPEVQAYAARRDLFTAVAAHASEPGAIGTTADPSSATSATIHYVTPNYLGILGVRPELGSAPAADANSTSLSTSPTAMISFALWMQRLGGRQDVLGQMLRINDVPVQIVGVAPERFVGTGSGDAMAVWVPLGAYPLLQKRTPAVFSSADSMFLGATARVPEGLPRSAISPVVGEIASRMAPAATPPEVRRASAEVVPLLAANEEAGDRRDALVSAAASGGFALLLLLVTCTNVSGIMLGLAAARRREIGVRLSLGAARGRLIRQLLTESVVLALAAAALGLVAISIGLRVAGRMLPDLQLAVDWRVAVATCAVAIATGLLFGLSPALHATRVSIGEVLKGSTASVSAAQLRLQRALVVTQVALTQPLLVGVGVAVLTMVSDRGRVATASVADRIVEIEIDTWAGQVSDAERSARISAAVERTAAMPGVVSAMPLQMGTIGAPLVVHPSDRVAGLSTDVPMRMSLVSAPRGYFSAFGIPFVRGRDFNPEEHRVPPGDGRQPLAYETVVIGSDLARRLWDTADPIGRRLTMRGPGGALSLTMTVVGVVDANIAGPSDVNGQVRVYVPYSVMNTGVIVRTAGPASAMLGALTSAVAAEAPRMPLLRAQTIEQRQADQRRDALRMSGAGAAAGLLTLLLSAIGLYAVIAFAVGQRTREIGIRMALGSSSARVVRMFFGNGLVLGAVGLVLGLPLSMVATRMISSAFNWPLATSPMLGLGIGLVVLGVVSLASWIPARRASRIDPLLALRSE